MPSTQEYIVNLKQIDNSPVRSPVSVIAVTGPGEVHLMHPDNRGGRKHIGTKPNWIYLLSSSPNHSPGCYDRRGDNSTTHNLIVPPVINIKIKLHILYAPIGITRDSVLDDFIRIDVAKANELWAKNRFGVQISEIVPATQSEDSSISSLADFSCEIHQQKAEEISSGDKNYIHIFLTKSVSRNSNVADENMKAGWVCNFPQNYAAIAYGRSSTLLSHELGHVMGLTHSDNSNSCQLRYPADNIMRPYFNERKSLTAGQIIRAHIDPDSMINKKHWRKGDTLAVQNNNFADCNPYLFPRLDYHDNLQFRPSMFTLNVSISSLQPAIRKIVRRDPEATDIVRSISEGEYDYHIEETIFNELEHLRTGDAFTEEVAKNQQQIARRRATSILSTAR